MEGDKKLRLTDREIAQAFSDPAIAAKFPPILTLEEAAELGRVKIGTLRDWRSRGLLGDCSHKCGKEVKFWRDRFVKALFDLDVAAPIKKKR